MRIGGPPAPDGLARAPRTTDLPGLAEMILRARPSAPASRAVLVALSGIDGAGKGHVAARLAEPLEAAGLRVAPLHVDGWLHLPPRRFSDTDPAGHFYRHAIRFDEMFQRLVLPLRDRRSLRLEAALVTETATAYHRHVYDFRDVDVVLLEGIYLLKRAVRRHYDLSVWVDCTFQTALERAILRRQEGLSRDATVAAYRTLYFPAQEIHFREDDPRGTATVILPNDPRLARAPAAGAR